MYLVEFRIKHTAHWRRWGWYHDPFSAEKMFNKVNSWPGHEARLSAADLNNGRLKTLQQEGR